MQQKTFFRGPLLITFDPPAVEAADILVVDGRPLQQLADLSRVGTVVRGGRLYDVRTLRTLVGMTSGGGMAGADGWDGESAEAIPVHLRPVHFHAHDR